VAVKCMPLTVHHDEAAEESAIGAQCTCRLLTSTLVSPGLPTCSSRLKDRALSSTLRASACLPCPCLIVANSR